MNARDYAKVYLTYWTGTTGQRITTPDAKLVGLYLFTGPHVMLTHSGVWRINDDTVEEHTNIKPDAYRAALAVLEEAGLIEQDQRRKWIWVREFAMFQLCGQGRPNAPSPDIRKCWIEYVALSRQCPDLAERWYERYESDLFMRDSPSVEAVRLGKRTTEIPRGKSSDSKKTSDNQSETRRNQSDSMRTQSATSPSRDATSPIQGDTDQVQSATSQKRAGTDTSILYQDTIIGSEGHRVIGSECRTHAHEAPSMAELRSGAIEAWLEDTLEERAKTIMSASLAEIPIGMEDHVSELKVTAQAVASEYMRQCPGVVKSRNLLLGIARAVTALADDSELGCEEAKRRLFVMLEWFKRGNYRRYQNPETQTGKDWFGDAIEVFGGMAGMVSAAGVPRDTASVIGANMTQAMGWKADEDARNTPVLHWREEDHPIPPSDVDLSDPQEFLRAGLAAIEAGRKRGAEESERKRAAEEARRAAQ